MGVQGCKFYLRVSFTSERSEKIKFVVKKIKFESPSGHVM